MDVHLSFAVKACEEDCMAICGVRGILWCCCRFCCDARSISHSCSQEPYDLYRCRVPISLLFLTAAGYAGYSAISIRKQRAPDPTHSTLVAS